MRTAKFTAYLVALCVLFNAGTAQALEVVYTYTGANQSFVVPAGITSIQVAMWGAGGGGTAGTGGAGGYTKGTIAVTPGQVLTVFVGGGGQGEANLALGGWPNGGNSGNTRVGYFGAGGGGRSAVTTSGGIDLLVAGGGGAGGAHNVSETRGGAGGGSVGQDAPNSMWYSLSGKGGTQSAGGSGGTFGGGPGSFHQGGHGDAWNGTGGGDGYYGGGAGDDHQGGGGGSGYIGGPGVSEATTLVGSYQMPAGTSDPLYTSPKGYGGNALSPGQHGLVVIKTVNTATPPEAPALVSPMDLPPGNDFTAYGRTLNPRTRLIWSIPSDTESNKVHFKVYYDQTTASTLAANSSNSQAGFEFYNGTAWDSFPAAGVPSTNTSYKVRFEPQSDLSNNTNTNWRVVANDGTVDGASSPTNRFWVGGRTWTDAVLTGNLTRIRKVHMDELRQEANYARASRGLAANAWTDAALTADQTLIRAVHFTELRDAIRGLTNVTGETLAPWTDDPIVPNQTLFRTNHVIELRKALESL